MTVDRTVDRTVEMLIDPDSLRKLGTPMTAPVSLDALMAGFAKPPAYWVFDTGWRPLDVIDPMTKQRLRADIDLFALMVTRNGGSVSTTSGFHINDGRRVVRYDSNDRTAKVSDPSGAVIYQGDSVDGTESIGADGKETDGPDEAMHLWLSRLPDDVHQIILLLNIHKEEGYPQAIRDLTFGQVARCFGRVYPEGRPDLAQVFQMTEAGRCDTVVMGRFERKPNGSWEFEQIMNQVPSLAHAIQPYAAG